MNIQVKAWFVQRSLICTQQGVHPAVLWVHQLQARQVVSSHDCTLFPTESLVSKPCSPSWRYTFLSFPMYFFTQAFIIMFPWTVIIKLGSSDCLITATKCPSCFTVPVLLGFVLSIHLIKNIFILSSKSRLRILTSSGTRVLFLGDLV